MFNNKIMEPTTYTTPIWYYQLSGINWNIHNEIWNESDDIIGALFKVKEGVLLGQLISIAAVIEGSLKQHLKSKITDLFYRSNEIKQTLRKYNNRSGIQFASEDELRKNLEAKELELANIYNRYPKGKNNKYFSCNFYIWIFKLNIQWAKKDRAINQSSIEQLITKIEKSSWQDLKAHFTKIEGERLRQIINADDPNLSKKLDKLFEFRNFIVHSNSIQSEKQGSQIIYLGKTKSLIKYLKENDLNEPGSSSFKYFIEEIITLKLITHFKEALELYINTSLFKNTITRTHIWENRQ